MIARKSKTKVAESCGCVFCDIKLKPREHDGELMHYVRAEKKWVRCLSEVVLGKEIEARAAKNPFLKDALFREVIGERIKSDREFARWLLWKASVGIVRHRKAAKREGKKK